MKERQRGQEEVRTTKPEETGLVGSLRQENGFLQSCLRTCHKPEGTEVPTQQTSKCNTPL